MKIFISILLAVFIFSAPSVIYAEIKLGGEMSIAGRQGHNFDLNKRLLNPGRNGEGQYYEQTVRLQLDATVSPNLKAFIEMQHEGSDTATWGISGAGDTSHQGYQGVQSRYFGSLRQAWMLYTGRGLGFPSGLKIGHQLFILGNGVFYDSTKYGNDAIVFFMDPAKETHIRLITIKVNEGTSNINDDTNGYIGVITHRLGENHRIGLDVSQLRKQNSGRATTAYKKTTTLSNIGITADGEFIGLGYSLDLQLQSGKGDNTASLGTVAARDANISATENIKYSGMAALLGLSKKINIFTIKLEGAYGSGDKSGSTNKMEAFQAFLGDDPRYTFIYENRVGQSGYSTTGGDWTVNFGLSNTTYGRFGITADLLKNLTAVINIFKLRATKALNIANVSTGSSRDLGYEYDLSINYAIADGLDYSIKYGNFKPGSFYDRTPKNSAWALDHGLSMRF